MLSRKQPFQVIISEEVSFLPDEAGDISYFYEPDLWQSPEKLAQLLRSADGLIVRNQTNVNAALLSGAEKLKVIGRLGAGLDNIDLHSAQIKGIKVVYAPEANTISVAEYCLAQIMNILRGLPDAARSTASGEWKREQFIGKEISEAVIGLVGFGKTAQALAERITNLEGSVIVFTRSPDKVPQTYEYVSLGDLLARSDIVSLHLPGGSDTRHLIGSEQFSLMRPSCWLLNTSRGSVVDEAALLEALDSGEIAGAVLDVREIEPPERGELEKLPNLIGTPHIAAFTGAAQARVNQTVYADVAAVLRGKVPRFKVRS